MQTTLGPNPLYQASRGLQRLSQEAMWQEVIYGLEQRRPDIEEQLDREEQAAGSLTLNPDLKMPEYYDNTEFHLQPGNFHKNTLAGPVYEIGVATYTVPLWQGERQNGTRVSRRITTAIQTCALCGMWSCL